jgi:xanthosine utilization system XapX-like protein
VPLAKSIWAREPAALSWLHQVKPHMFGHLPQGGLNVAEVTPSSEDPTREKS